jgi:DNA helicase-2/ATP-dependent DNA helicase PcrA
VTVWIIGDDSDVPARRATLKTLIQSSRRAVEHASCPNVTAAGSPLLVIAGAGSGKTNTLAHRVAHLIVERRRSRRILLMTFSRRAAREMNGTRRADRAQGDGRQRGIMTDALHWAGTFHGIGARCCATMPTRSASIPPSRSTTARIPPT